LQPRSARMLMGAGVTSGRALGSALLAAVGQPPWERPAGSLPETAERRSRRLEMVRLLLDAGAPADACGGALVGAAVNGHEPLVALLRERGATAGLPDEKQMRRTWFTLAVLDRREEASALVRLGLRPDLNAAAAFGDARRVREILAADPAFARAAQPGTTSLVLAARAGHLEIVDLLLAAGAPADGTVRTNGRWPGTPLEAAASRGRLEVMRRLIDAGADVNAKDTNGKTLLKRVLQNSPDYPEFHPTPAVADLLRRHGAAE